MSNPEATEEMPVISLCKSPFDVAKQNGIQSHSGMHEVSHCLGKKHIPMLMYEYVKSNLSCIRYMHNYISFFMWVINIQRFLRLLK